jgi:hypothetical protein
MSHYENFQNSLKEAGTKARELQDPSHLDFVLLTQIAAVSTRLLDVLERIEEKMERKNVI